MTFDKEIYILEMSRLLADSIKTLNKHHKDFLVYSVNIWTDPNAAISAINFDSKDNSDKAIKSSNDFNKKYYDNYIQAGDTEQAKLFEQTITRNCNPADFELAQFATIENTSFQADWEENSNGGCWDILEEALKEFAVMAIDKLHTMNLHPEFELSVNGREDWYMFTWK